MRASQNYLFLTAVMLGLSGCIVVPQSSYQPLYQPATVTDNYAPAPQPVVQVQPAPEVVYQPPPPEVVPVYQDELSPYGRWVVYPRYGRCWAPYSVPNGWQPYTVGHWVYTDDGNCCWVSEGDEVAWGPTVYHYGQWAFTPDFGWVWVPGVVWSPAWVSWREGDGYCGWAPLPPEACTQPQVTYVVADQYCPPERYVYVQEGDIVDTRVDQRIVHNNTTIIHNTTNITNITVVNNRVVNGGVSGDHVQRYIGRPLQRTAVVNASTPDEARQLVSRGVPVHYSNAAINNQIQVQQQRQVQLQSKQQHDQQAAHQQQTQLDQQIKQEKQSDETKEAQLKNQEAHEQQIDRAQEAANARQAAVDKQIAHQQEVEQQKQDARDKAAAHAQDVEQQQQAARDKAADRQKQVDAQRQAQRDQQAAEENKAKEDRQAGQERQAQQDRDRGVQPDRQGQPDHRNGHDQGQQPPPQKAKARPAEPQNNPPPP